MSKARALLRTKIRETPLSLSAERRSVAGLPLRGGWRFVAVLAAALLAGCAVGPDFSKPSPPAVDRYTPEPLSASTASAATAGGEAQTFAAGADVEAEWWTLFHSKALDDLIAQALAKNPDLKSAQAALSAARENVLAQRGAYYPAVTAGLSASRQKQPASLAPVPSSNALLYNLFTPQVSVSYVPDVFGLNRRTVESLQAQEQQVRYQALAAYTTLTGNVVVAAIQQGSLEEQLDATRRLVEINTRMLQILQYQFAKGVVSRLDVAAQESQLAQVDAAVPGVVKQLQQQRDLLAVLAGAFPSAAPAETFNLADFELPAELPVSLPSKLVAQRPDVLQAQANLHAASAQIGVAVASRLPNIELSANAGSTALAIGQLFKSGTAFWTLGADLTAPIFQGGKLLHQERAARAAFEQASAQYRSTVLTAFQNVADTLVAIEQDARGLKAAAAAADAARVTLDLSQRQLQDGVISTLALLNAEQAYQQAQINLVQARASRLADSAALFVALGGGWWHRADLAQEHDEHPTD